MVRTEDDNLMILRAYHLIRVFFSPTVAGRTLIEGLGKKNFRATRASTEDACPELVRRRRVSMWYLRRYFVGNGLSRREISRIFPLAVYGNDEACVSSEHLLSGAYWNVQLPRITGVVQNGDV
jgi:hypothetical protein